MKKTNNVKVIEKIFKLVLTLDDNGLLEGIDYAVDKMRHSKKMGQTYERTEMIKAIQDIRVLQRRVKEMKFDI